VSLLMADQAFPQEADAAIAKIGVLAGSVIAAAIGATILALAPEHEVEPESELARD
jgi:NhaA family Na+:H+ antiporter